ncbi:DUF6538 domain-containing protein [Castellaniella sp.]|uniref:DUF6538 domain-containing protein n=1 Tax=Castellaniella sp. TaxID=1955812 RepID=UPI003A4C7381
MCTYLQRRGNRYYIRRAVPAGLRATYGRREVTRALGTSNYAEAKARCRIAAVKVDGEFRTIADALSGTQSATHDDLRQGTADTAPRYSGCPALRGYLHGTDSRQPAGCNRGCEGFPNR